MNPNERRCPVCSGVVKPVRRGGDPDATLDMHIETCHPDEVRAAKKALGLMTKNDMLAELGSAFQLPEEE